MMRYNIFPLSVLFIGALTFGSAFAQDLMPAYSSDSPEVAQDVESALPQEQGAAEQVAPAPKTLSMQDEVTPQEIPSLFFTMDALALIKDAIEGLNTSTNVDVTDGSEKEPGIRELALGGIVYERSDDWTIWLNGLRITPDTIPGEIFDLSVSKEYIDIKWYDAYTNRLYPIRLRANERFNLDSRLFLTGVHSEDQQL